VDPANGYQANVSNSLAVRLVAAAVRKPEPVGGWDLAGKKPRIMFKAVPAGSVYVFEKLDRVPLTEQDAGILKEHFQWQTLMKPAAGSEDPAAGRELAMLAQAGLGLALVGVA